MKRNRSFHPFALLTVVFWSFGFVLTRLALSHFSAFSLGFLRYFVASCTLLIFVLIIRMRLPAKKHLPLLLLSGAFGFFIYMITFNQGSKTVTAATASVIISIVPVLTALFARVFFKERLFGHQWVAIGIEFAGILILCLLTAQFTVGVGILWILIAASCISAYNLLQRRLTKTISGLKACTFSMFFGTLMLAVFASAAAQEAVTAPTLQIVVIICLGVFPSAVAYLLWSKAIEKASHTSYVSNYMFLTPFLTALLGFVLAGETLHTSTLIGGAVILSGALLFNKQSIAGMLRERKGKNEEIPDQTNMR